MKVVNIKWDIDTEDIENGVNLPTTVEVPAEIATDPDYADSEMKDALYDHISDWLSDTYGYCHSGFDIVESKSVSNVKNIVNKILDGNSVRDVLCVKLNEGFSEEFKQEIKNNPVNKKIKHIADKYGYVAKETFLYWYGGIHCSISPKDYNDFHPEVSISSDLDDDSVVEYRIQTTSYGSLSLDDYKEFLKCCDDAYNMMKEISELDLTKLAKEVKSE